MTGKTVGAAGRGRLRASHADREQAIDVLKAAFVQGRLDKDEFDARVGQAFSSRTYAELAGVTGDLPAEPAGAHRAPAPARPAGDTTVSRGVRAIAAVTVPTAGVWAAAWLSQADNAAVFLLVWTFTFIWFGIVILAGAVMLESRRQDRRSGGRSAAARPAEQA